MFNKQYDIYHPELIESFFNMDGIKSSEGVAIEWEYIRRN